jgi:hypothetical protein
MVESNRNGDHSKPNDIDHGWRKVQNKKSTAATARARKMRSTAINDTEGEGGMICQVGFIDLRFMFQTRKYNKVFHLARSLKDFVASGNAFNKEFSILPRYGDSAAICEPQDVPNSQYQLLSIFLPPSHLHKQR